jgi:hypothetical protein
MTLNPTTSTPIRKERLLKWQKRVAIFRAMLRAKEAKKFGAPKH